MSTAGCTCVIWWDNIVDSEALPQRSDLNGTLWMHFLHCNILIRDGSINICRMLTTLSIFNNNVWYFILKQSQKLQKETQACARTGRVQLYKWTSSFHTTGDGLIIISRIFPTWPLSTWFMTDITFVDIIIKYQIRIVLFSLNNQFPRDVFFILGSVHLSPPTVWCR